jgi:hypothetical protein
MAKMSDQYAKSGGFLKPPDFQDPKDSKKYVKASISIVNATWEKTNFVNPKTKQPEPGHQVVLSFWTPPDDKNTQRLNIASKKLGLNKTNFEQLVTITKEHGFNSDCEEEDIAKELLKLVGWGIRLGVGKTSKGEPMVKISDDYPCDRPNGEKGEGIPPELNPHLAAIKAAHAAIASSEAAKSRTPDPDDPDADSEEPPF